MNSIAAAQPFAAQSLIRNPVVIAHFSSLTVAFVVCFPMALILRQRRYQRLHQAAVLAGTVFFLLGLFTAWFAPPAQSGMVSGLHTLVSCILLVLLVAQCLLGWRESTPAKAPAGPLHEQTIRMALFTRIPCDAHLILSWAVLSVAYAYIILGVVLFTESCSEGAVRCVLPLATGGGIMVYGTLVLFHLLGLFQLPRTSTPEHFEGLAIASWGLVCLFMAGTPILGTSWNAINLGLLWLAGGVMALTISMQTWMPALREKNVANAMAICLTGRSIITGYTQQEAYIADIHSALGWMLIVGSAVRILQIIFRKSPVDNFPRMFKTLSLALQSPENDTGCAEESDEDMDADDNRPTNRHNALNQAYDQLVGNSRQSSSEPTTPVCKHESIFASITIVCAMLTSVLAMASGILMMGANVGWLGHMRYYIHDPSTYVNLVLAFTLGWTTYILIVCTLYKSIKPATPFEYLGLEPIDTTPPLLQDGLQFMAEHRQRYEEARNVRRSNSLPSRRSSIARPSSISSNFNSSNNATTVRPSEYREKRRSLLLMQPPAHKSHTNQTTSSHRARSQSSFTGLGINHLENYESSDGTNAYTAMDNSAAQRSWLMDSGTFDPLQSPVRDTKTHDYRRSAFFPENSIQLGEHNKNVEDEGVALYSSASSFHDSPTETDLSPTRSVHKTESGKRKERQITTTRRRRSHDPLTQRRRSSTGSSSSISSNCSNYNRSELCPRSPSAQAQQPSNATAYYWTERNSSDGHFK